MLESDSEHHCWEQPKITEREYILPLDCYVKISYLQTKIPQISGVTPNEKRGTKYGKTQGITSSVLYLLLIYHRIQ